MVPELEIHVLFECGFYLKKPKLDPDLHVLRDTGKRCGRDWSFCWCFDCKNIAHVYIGLPRLQNFVNVYTNFRKMGSVSARPEFLGVIDDPLFENLGVIGKFRGSELF